MERKKVVPFPVSNPRMFSPEINRQVLETGELQRVLYAAITALPHVTGLDAREELKAALCELLSFDDVA